MVEERKRGRPTKKDQHFEATLAKARLEAKAALNQKREGAVDLRYVAERLRDIKNMDEVEEFYKECVYNIGINTLHNGEDVCWELVNE